MLTIGTQRPGQAPRALPLFSFSSVYQDTQGRKVENSGGQLPKRPSRKAFFESTTQDSGEREGKSLPLVIAGSKRASTNQESRFNQNNGSPDPSLIAGTDPPFPPLLMRRGRLGLIYKILLKLSNYATAYMAQRGNKQHQPRHHHNPRSQHNHLPRQSQ